MAKAHSPVLAVSQEGRLSKSKSFIMVGLLALLPPLLATGCASGGSPSPAPAASAPAASAPTPSSSTITATTPCCADTGITGTVGAPAPAAYGTAPLQTATANGPAFSGGSLYPVNVTFPLISTSMQQTSSGFAAAPADKSATVTVINTSPTSSTFQLNIPSLNVNFTGTLNTSLVAHVGQVLDGYAYMVMGSWLTRADPANGRSPLLNSSMFVFGYETPASAMPASGTAAFGGFAAVDIYKTGSTTIQSAYADGKAFLTANFGSGQVSGALTEMQTYVPTGTDRAWNDVSINAAIANGSNRFSGTTAVTSAPSTPMALSSSATGRIDGAFYGPSAQNLGAVWTLHDDASSALGTIMAAH
jgi:hypothetical protein